MLRRAVDDVVGREHHRLADSVIAVVEGQEVHATLPYILYTRTPRAAHRRFAVTLDESIFGLLLGHFLKRELCRIARNVGTLEFDVAGFLVDACQVEGFAIPKLIALQIGLRYSHGYAG